jgi:hypothetical protein
MPLPMFKRAGVKLFAFTWAMSAAQSSSLSARRTTFAKLISGFFP